MAISRFKVLRFAAIFAAFASTAAFGQSFRVQCPATTALHPIAKPNTTTTLLNESNEDPYVGPSMITPAPTLGGVTGVTFDGGDGKSGAYDGQHAAYISNGGAIKCQEVSGGDGFATEADGTQTYLFAFGPLSGLDEIQNGRPGTLFSADFNKPFDPGLTFMNTQPNPLQGIAGGTLNGAARDVGAIMNTGVLNGNIPAPLVAIDEDDELFLTLSNVGMIMRPDLFEQHTIHFHGYPNASSFYDGVPDASAAINIGGSFTYYYLAPDAGTYFWHCHITPPEHLQMGMVGQLFVRPRQNRVDGTKSLFQWLQVQQTDLRTACNPSTDILCATPLPKSDNSVVNTPGTKYAYNDGDGSTRYDIDVPIQIHGFDPNFHFVGMTFNPEGFADMKDKFFLLNGRSYPDTVNTGTFTTEASDTVSRPSQPLHTLITLKQGQRALLRISDLDVTEYQTLASLGIPMQLIAHNARLLRDQDGNNLYITTNSITLAGGESLDVILDSTGIPGGTYFLYTTNLDHLSNDAENFGGLMTEIVVVN